MKTGIRLTSYLILAFFLSAFCSYGQVKKPGIPSVYLQTDRSYYLTGESVYFKAWISDDTDSRSVPGSDTLGVILMDQYGQEVASGLFPVINNKVTDNIELSDFLAEGYYILIASVNLKNEITPDNIFSKAIEIRKSFETDFTTDLSLTDSLYKTGANLTAKIIFSAKNNKPVPADFTYRLTGISGEKLSGKSKASSEGIAVLDLQLPEFDKKEILKLIVAPSYKGKQNITGIVVPTLSVLKGTKTHDESYPPPDNFRQINIHLKTDKLRYNQKENVRLDIEITDDKGNPVMADLSVSASNMLPGQISPENENKNQRNNKQLSDSDWRKAISELESTDSLTENIITDDNQGGDSFLKSQIRSFFVKSLLNMIQEPGCQFVVQEKNNLKKLQRKVTSNNQQYQNGYPANKKVLDIIMAIKSYHILNGMIFFSGSSINSQYGQEGALIIVDGIKMGTDVGILDNLPITEIAKISASTNPSDIQRYSGLNTTGIIEIVMKKNAAFAQKDEPEVIVKGNTLYWVPDILTDRSGKASINFLNSNKSGEVVISVYGVAITGHGNNSIYYSVE